MDAFVWDQNFVTGLPEVDEQHHKLVDLFNEFNNSLFSTRTDQEQDAVLSDTFARILDYTRYHFQDEESLMRAEGVDSRHANMHHLAHEHFVEQLQAMWERRHTMPQPGESLVNFLTSWLGLHILGIDQSLARQIQLIHNGAGPAEAFEQEDQALDNGMQAVLKLIANLYRLLSQQNMALVQANQALEARVAQRTVQLETANERLQQAYVQLEAYSRIDGLLKIANRQYFDVRLKEAWASALRRQQPLGLLMIDVDFFKRYNDSYGHQAGDTCLQTVAQAVQGALLRETDLVARYGGEELVVILPDTDAAGTLAVAERVVAAVAAQAIPHRASDAAPVVTVSVGAASCQPTDMQDGLGLVAQADAALYAAKKSGRNRSVLSDV
ncbi:MAG: diguanylate cyclase [Hydrogenophaga sp.]|jgi:hemerythrin|uniref:diguanylate cyclase domain-containing protein n=1 Tax=Hydrogenophaga sp. TaxID=1904254 RepID=UPI002724A065|nr:diguanylate cyclase [Hydrogenophaga sp.]MDO9480265.1 diguanylate cyclase [Hydrogenophaga sp.]MDP1893062.1 diguanylate cyclase [Hydrogenophaga sp.]MDP2221452.1 diguanylate cyclase [Hydrogenophaga sp.]MDP3345301.1 diguanylate cyclase [Hydrogenophaga sp.]MDP3807193.1 diguanylate cyclase [Hydrogenophaga sp.]